MQGMKDLLVVIKSIIHQASATLDNAADLWVRTETEKLRPAKTCWHQQSVSPQLSWGSQRLYQLRIVCVVGVSNVAPSSS